MEGAAALEVRGLGEGEEFVVPGPHEDMFEDAGEGFVDGDGDDLALAGLAGVAERGEGADGGVDAGDEGVLVAEESEGRSVDIAAGGGDAAEGFGDEAGGLVAGPGAVGAEG